MLFVSLMEIVGLTITIRMAENGHPTWAAFVGAYTIVFAYAEGRYSWGQTPFHRETTNARQRD